MKTTSDKKYSVVLVMAILLVWTCGAVADDTTAFSSQTRSNVDIDSMKLSKVNVTIKTKETDKIRTKVYDFKVTDLTEFLVESGQNITFEAFPVPCRATVYYEPAGSPRKIRIAWRVMIERVANNHTTHFSEPEGQ